MFRYLVRRLLWAAVLFVAVTFVSYVVFFLIPADPAQLAAGKAATPEKIREVERYLGLDQPLHVQYAKFMERLVVDRSLGTSFATRQDVNEIVFRAAPVTASLVFGGVIVWLAVSIPIGILSALRPRSLLDRSTMVLVLIGISAHPVWIGLLLAYFFAYKLGWFPISGYCDVVDPATDCGGPVQWAYHMVLPWATFACVFAASYTRFIRASVMETLNEDFVRTARAKGAPERRVMRTHVLRNAMLTIVTILGLDIGLAMGGAIFTEAVFGLPGLGQTVIGSIASFDLPVTQGVIVFATLCIIAANLIVDLAYAWVDPRIRLA
jgi:peptide/nickel transport system permease protein